MSITPSKANNLNVTTVINNITKALKNLLLIIKKENEHLKQGKLSGIGLIIENKVDAIQKFNESQLDLENYIRAEGQFDQEADYMVKLGSMLKELNKLNHDNEVLIISNLEVSSKLVEMYKDRKTQETLRQFGYNDKGKLSAVNNIEKIMPSIGLNDKV